MSRHRNIRSMNYSEEYEGFDDVFGHSVEDDHCISPSEARFLYDRTRHPQISAFISKENGIAEEDELVTVSDAPARKFDKFQPNRINEEKLRLCVDDIQDVIGDMISVNSIEEIALKFDYDVEKALDHILKGNETLGNILLEEPLPQREKLKNKDKDEDTKTSVLLESKSMIGLFSGGGDGPSNPVRKFVIPKLKNTQVERLEKGVNEMKIQGNALTNFSSLKTLMEHHQKFGFNEIEKKESSDGNSPSTLAEFSKSFLNKKNPTDNSSFSTDDPKPSFVIPKLQKKIGDESESKWLIDLSSALKSNSEPAKTPYSRDPPGNDSETQTVCQASQNIFFESNFDASKILNAALELRNERSSPFGKILCRKWTCNYVNVDKRENFLGSRVVQFDFSTPSPDDIILKYIRRK